MQSRTMNYTVSKFSDKFQQLTSQNLEFSLKQVTADLCCFMILFKGKLWSKEKLSSNERA